MCKQDKENEQPYLGVYVICRLKWVDRVLKQIQGYQVGDTGMRAEQGFVQRCNFEPFGVVIQLHAKLAIALRGRVELWVTSSAGTDPVVAVCIGGKAGR